MIVVGWLDNGTTAGEFTDSVSRLAAYEAHMGRLSTTIRVQSGPMLEEGRNKLVQLFLDTPGAEWLMSIDSDMSFSYKAVEQLLAVADPVDAPLVGGLCFAVTEQFGVVPTIYRSVDGLSAVWTDYPRDELVPVDATGAAFTLTHRTLFEQYPRDHFHKWFHRREVAATEWHEGGVLGEDVSWCWWLRDHGVPMFVDTRVKVGHVKQVVIDDTQYPHPADRPSLVLA